MDWLPSAARDTHARSFPWQNNAPPRGVLHTTESSGWPDYEGWTIMPHATVLPIAGRGIQIRQHLPFSQGSFALRHTDPANPTGGAHAFQFELVGTCDRTGPGYYWPGAEDVVLKDLWLKVIEPLSTAFSIPLRAPSFLPYPASYGDTDIRMSNPQWEIFAGWCGHEHVPQNDHGDPGSFPWARLMALAGSPKPTNPPIHGPLKYGSTGSDVERLQHRLDKQLGVRLDVDGVFGRQTLIQVEDWQKKHGLTQDGVVGPNTAKSLGFAYVTA